MTLNLTNHLSHSDLSDIRDAVPALDLLAIRSLRRAGFEIVRRRDTDLKGDQRQAQQSDWATSDRSSSAA